jgi:cbb3-type cytochrome oxidase maturation protein
MEVIIILLPLAIFLAGIFVAAFIWAAKKGQYDDLESPSYRMLLDDQSMKLKDKKSIKDEK